MEVVQLFFFLFQISIPMHDILILGFYIINYIMTPRNKIIWSWEKHKHILQAGHISYHIWSTKSNMPAPVARPQYARYGFSSAHACKTQEKWCWNVTGQNK